MKPSARLVAGLSVIAAVAVIVPTVSPAAAAGPGGYRVLSTRLYFVDSIHYGKPQPEYVLFFRLNKKAPVKADGSKEAGALINGVAPPPYDNPRKNFTDPDKGGWGAGGGTNSLKSPGACYVNQVDFASGTSLLPAKVGGLYKITVFAGPATLVTHTRLKRSSSEGAALKHGREIGC